MGSTAMTNGKISPFSLLVDGMMSNEDQVVLTTLSQLMATKMD